MSLGWDDEVAGGYQDADLEMAELARLADETPEVAPDAHLEADYEDRVSGAVEED